MERDSEEFVAEAIVGDPRLQIAEFLLGGFCIADLMWCSRRIDPFTDLCRFGCHVPIIVGSSAS